MNWPYVDTGPMHRKALGHVLRKCGLHPPPRRRGPERYDGDNTRETPACEGCAHEKPHGAVYTPRKPDLYGLIRKFRPGIEKAIADAKAQGRPEIFTRNPCGDSGKFESKNTCATGGRSATTPSKTPKKSDASSAGKKRPPTKGEAAPAAKSSKNASASVPIPDDQNPDEKGLTQAQSRKRVADNIEKRVARMLGKGSVWVPGNLPSDARVPKPGGGFHEVEVKSKTFGAKKYLSVHAGALYDKVVASKKHPENAWHTVLIDERDTSEGGAHAQHFIGKRMYYKRAAGAYGVHNMHPVNDEKELKRLMAMKDEDLPPAARGEFPRGKALKALAEKAVRDREYNNERSRDRKAEKRARGESAYRR